MRRECRVKRGFSGPSGAICAWRPDPLTGTRQRYVSGMSAGLGVLHDMFAASPHPDTDSQGVSPYILPPTIPAGMTIAEYRRARPAKPSLRRQTASWVATDAWRRGVRAGSSVTCI
jgi:hypothetical protein